MLLHINQEVLLLKLNYLTNLPLYLFLVLVKQIASPVLKRSKLIITNILFLLLKAFIIILLIPLAVKLIVLYFKLRLGRGQVYFAEQDVIINYQIKSSALLISITVILIIFKQPIN